MATFVYVKKKKGKLVRETWGGVAEITVLADLEMKRKAKERKCWHRLYNVQE